MYQMQMNDKVRHPSVDATLTVKAVTGAEAECAWIDGKAVKMAVFAVDELDYAPDSIKGMAKAAVRGGFAGGEQTARDAAMNEKATTTT